MQVGTPEALSRRDLEGIRFDGAAPIRKIRASHHQVAQCLARGLTNLETSAITGYTPVRISQLAQDPTFAALRESYTNATEREFTDTVRRMAMLSLDALEEIQSRLDESPESLETEDLLKIATATLDRTGHAPVTKVQQTSVTLSRQDILEMKAQAQELVISPLPRLSNG